MPTARALGIETDGRHDGSLVLGLAREHALSVYDASYLEVASRRRLPLATLDRKLSEAAVAAGVPTINCPRLKRVLAAGNAFHEPTVSRQGSTIRPDRQRRLQRQ